MFRGVGRRSFLVFTLVGLSFCPSAAWSQAGNQKASYAPVSDEQALGIQKQFFDAMIAQDAHAMEALSADDMIYVHLNGLKQTKSEFLSWVANMQFKKFTLTDYKIHAYNGAFVLSGNVEDTRGMHLLLTTVWEQRPRGWQMVVLQYTGVPDPKPANAAAPKAN